MLNLLKQKKDTFSGISLNNLYINKSVGIQSEYNKQENYIYVNNNVDKNVGIQSKSNKDEYRNVIFYPASSKEWFNSVYAYNKSYTKLLINMQVSLSDLFKSFFNMLQDKVVFKRRRDNKSRYSANKIYVSRPELKHTNTKLLITLYTYNKQKVSIERDMRKLVIFKKDSGFKGTVLETYLNRTIHLLKDKILFFKQGYTGFFKNTDNLLKYLQTDLKRIYLKLHKRPPYYNIFLKKVFRLKQEFFNTIRFINFNKTKFNLVFKLGLIGLIQKIFSKKIEINLVDLKAIHLNSDVFASAVALKLRDRKNKAVRVLRKAVIQIVKIPALHTLITFDDYIKNFGYSIGNINGNTIGNINENNVGNIYGNNIGDTYRSSILNTIKLQVVSGVRFEAAGRLTRRLTAMRAIFKNRYIGSLKNIRSSYNNISSTLLRGYFKSNLEYTLVSSKTRNGTFGLKS